MIKQQKTAAVRLSRGSIKTAESEHPPGMRNLHLLRIHSVIVAGSAEVSDTDSGICARSVCVLGTGPQTWSQEPLAQSLVAASPHSDFGQALTKPPSLL